jgi:hypothetical protein
MGENMNRKVQLSLLAGAWASLAGVPLWAANAAARVAPDWTRITATTKSSIAIQDCPEPPLYRGTLQHDNIYKALRDLNGDYSRLQPWYPYPKLAVAELRPPETGRTYWNFTLMDQLVEDFMLATQGHPVVFQPGTIPAWMTSSAPVRYPEDATQIDWTYGRDAKFQESTVKQFADYQARLAGWYIKGGFTDEIGKRYESGHHYRFDYWEPLNEEDQRFTPEQMTRLYDAAVAAVRKIVPGMKFMGPALAGIEGRPQYVAYFFNPANHAPGTPIDMVSYHYYTVTKADETPQIMQYTMYEQADKLFSTVGYIEAIRKQFLPKAGTDINELGSIVSPSRAVPLPRPFPASHWALTGAVWAYMYGNLAAKGIEVITAAELIDYPGQFAGTTLVDWDTGLPNAHYWVVKMLRDNFQPGDRMVYQTPPDEHEHVDPRMRLYSQGFITPRGERRILIVNKTDRPVSVNVAGAAGGNVQLVDVSTASLPRAQAMASESLQLPPSAVAVVTLAR